MAPGRAAGGKEKHNMDLTRWLTTLSELGSRKLEDVGLLPLLTVMVISLLCSFFLSFLYSKFYKGRATGSQVHRSFPLLGISVTAIFICIQFSLPLSLGLLGALSIVRFRTPIKEAEEIGFIMIVVASSLCIATFNLAFLGIILATSVLGVLGLNLKGGLIKNRPEGGMFVVTLPSDQYRERNGQVMELLEKHMPTGKLDSVTANKQETTVSYSFVRLDNGTLTELQAELNSISGDALSNVFFNRTAA